MTFYHPFPPRDGCLGTWCCRDLCPCDRECLEEIWLLMNADDCWTMVSELVYDWCFIITVFLHYCYRTDLTTSTVPAAHEPVTTFTLTIRLTVARHSRTRARDVSRSSFRHGATSPLFVNCRGLDIASLLRFAVPVALEPRRAPSTSWPRTSHRRPPSFSAVHHATSVRQPERHFHRTIRT